MLRTPRHFQLVVLELQVGLVVGVDVGRDGRVQVFGCSIIDKVDLDLDYS